MRNRFLIGFTALTLGAVDAPVAAQFIDSAAIRHLAGDIVRPDTAAPALGDGALIGTIIGLWPDGMTVGYGASRGAVYGLVPGLLLGYLLYSQGEDNK